MPVIQTLTEREQYIAREVAAIQRGALEGVRKWESDNPNQWEMMVAGELAAAKYLDAYPVGMFSGVPQRVDMEVGGYTIDVKTRCEVLDPKIKDMMVPTDCVQAPDHVDIFVQASPADAGSIAKFWLWGWQWWHIVKELWVQDFPRPGQHIHPIPTLRLMSELKDAGDRIRREPIRRGPLPG